MSITKSATMDFKNYKVFNYTFAGRPLVIESGKVAGLANGSVLVRYGDTAILCCATASPKQVGGQAVLGRQLGKPTPWPTERHGYDPT